MISVCLASFNGELFIRAQLQSILGQINADDEIIVSDGGSTDRTLEVIQSLQDSRIKVLTTDAQLGVIKNFEKAISHAKGEFIFLCDQDDIWLNGKVDRCLEVLAEHLLVVTDCRVVDQELNLLHESFFNLRNSGPGLVKNLIKNSYLGCCMAFRRSLLNYAMPFPSFIPMHDMWLGALADSIEKVVFIHEPLSLYRRHSAAATPTAANSTFSLMTQFKFRFQLVLPLFIRLLTRSFHVGSKVTR